MSLHTVHPSIQRAVESGILPLFVAPSLTIPAEAGRLALGTWQSVVLVDPNRENNEREVRLSFVAG